MANKKRVMIVDDDQDILLSLRQLLEAKGYKVYTFDNGHDFIKTLEEGKKPTLIILDVMMPTINGWQIQKILEANPKWAKYQIFFLTGRSTESAIEMYEKYATDYIIKPFDINEMLNKVNNVLFGENVTSQSYQ